ncbi:MAG: hypothetical protein M1829_004231 [Trizodia sp. TS-e1964]|nr:MAG: hypothetical protein M1829_004231 [Trizodia sp. TS-e1964]
MAEERQPSSISARIAALKVNEVGRSVSGPPATREAKQYHGYARHSPGSRMEAVELPPPSYAESTSQPGASRRAGGAPSPTPPSITYTKAARPQPPRPAIPPRLPARRTDSELPPRLPPRRPSSQSLGKRISTESLSSTVSVISAGTSFSSASSSAATENPQYRVLAPSYDPSTLPPLPPKALNDKAPKRIPPRPSPVVARAASRASSPAIIHRAQQPATATNGVPRALPPPLPSRRTESDIQVRKLPAVMPPPMPKRSALSYGLNKSTELAPPIPARPITPQPNISTSSIPPAIPFASRPRASTSLKPVQNISAASGSCLVCRNFSGPDDHAARFPRTSIPSTSIDWIAAQLTSPFPSLTDKARAIFTWLHHNISYDTAAFFENNVKASTPASTISSGLAVCEGYAGLFAALALKAGLDAVVVSGHGKGFGYSPLAPGQPLPQFNGNHAWSALKIDNGEWKLIDACWGAGHIDASQSYVKEFNPKFFSMSNEHFGERHFPTDRNQFFRADGRSPTWEEYMIGDGRGEPPQVFNPSPAMVYGISEFQLLPKHKKIASTTSQQSSTRFQFEKVCQHWDSELQGKGKPKLLLLGINNPADSQRFIPFQSNAQTWWLDVPTTQLGSAGQTVNVFPVETIDGKAVPGIGIAEFNAAVGRKAMTFGNGLFQWELA